MKWCALTMVIAAALVAAPATATPAAPALAEAAHAFDGEFGVWTIHTRRLMHPLAHAHDWATYEGRKVVTPLWNGRANIAEVRESGPAGELNFAALRLFNTDTGQWSLNFTSANSGAFGTPLFGEAHHGVVEFAGPDTFEGRAILVRFISREIDANHARSEQYFSDDGGHTWELNWVNDYTRTSGTPAPAAENTAASDAHDFDFALGAYHTSIRRLLHPLTGSSEWLRYEGTKTDAPILDGAGSMEQIEADGPSHLEFMTVRLYNARAHQWSLNFSGGGDGALSTPAIGQFRDGLGTFVSEEPYEGRTILVRQLWGGVTPTTYHFEQAFSVDFGATWETNFIADLTRIASGGVR